MDIFGNKKVVDLENEVKDLKREITEVKGYYDNNNIDNVYFEQAFKLMNSTSKMLDFSPVDRSKFAQMYETNPIVRGIVGTTIGNAVKELAQYIELQTPDKKQVLKHWAIDLLDKPNDRYNRGRFLKAWSINRNLTGDAFIYGIEGIGSSKGQYKEMYVLPSHDVEIIKGSWLDPIKGYKMAQEYNINNDKLTAKNVMFSFDYNTQSTTFYGLSPLWSAANMVSLLDSSSKRMNAAITNGGVSNIITPAGDTLGVTKTEADNAEQELNGKHLGNYSKFIRAKLEVHKLGDTPVDLAILDTSEFAINALCFVYGISVDSFLGQAKYNNAREAKKAIYEQAAIPLINEFLEDFTTWCGLKDMTFVLNTDKIEILKQNATEMVTALSLANGTINQKLELLGYQKRPEPYCDLPMIPLGYILGDPNFVPINENL